LLFALRREVLHLRRVYPPFQRIPHAIGCGWLVRLTGRRLLMLETGVGAAAMEAALTRLLQSSFRPSSVLCIGFCGALDPRRRVGDVFVSEEVCDAAGRSWPATWPAVSPALPRGRLLSLDRIVGDPAEKQRLGRQYQADAVDMESATAARLCQEQAIPFAALRVVSDDASTPLSPVVAEVLSRGQASPLRLMGVVLRRPWLLPELWRLARDTRRAAQALAAAVERLLSGE
jgi:adenosylhomocysteine nucleosidase